MFKRLLAALFGGGTTAAPTARIDDDGAYGLADCGFEIVETTGENALAKWEELKSAGRGVPLILGDSANELRMYGDEPIGELIAAADAVRLPHDLEIDEGDGVPLGEWPQPGAEIAGSSGLAIDRDPRTGAYLPKVYIALIPTDDPTTVPAYLRWGNFNGCPRTPVHIAALRHWRDQYGAELVGLTSDTMHIRVARRPATREEALELALVHYAFCPDIVEQGIGSISEMAAMLSDSDWWYFWWD